VLLWLLCFFGAVVVGVFGDYVVGFEDVVGVEVFFDYCVFVFVEGCGW